MELKFVFKFYLYKFRKHFEIFSHEKKNIEEIVKNVEFSNVIL